MTSIFEPQALDADLPSLPPAPTGLPRPWNGAKWLGALAVGLLLTYLVFWWLAARLNLAAEGAADDLACGFALGLFLLIGVGVYAIFAARGWWENYSAFSNKPLYRAIMRYRNPKANTGLLSRVYPRYMIGGRPYLLVWYLPEARLPSPNLSFGAEPLLFDVEGNWIDEEALFHKAILMWSVALFICPGTPLDRSLVRDVQRLKLMAEIHLARLPSLLAVNAGEFRRRGLGDDLNLVQAAYEAKCAWWRSAIHIGSRKIEWANAHGWDGMPELRYEGVLAFYNAYAEWAEVGRRFVMTHGLTESEQAALRLSAAVRSRNHPRGGWTDRSPLDAALQQFAAPFEPEEIEFRRVDGEWQAPEQFLQAYRSRLAYARLIDSERSVAKAALRSGP